jgi:hypothetical protein
MLKFVLEMVMTINVAKMVRAFIRTSCGLNLF